jgi:hypothetical protein
VLADGDYPDDARLEGADHSPTPAEVLAAVTRPVAVGREQAIAGRATTLCLQFRF